MQVIAGGANVCALARYFPNLNSVAIAFAVFLHDHGVAVGRQRSAGSDAHAFAFADTPGKRVAGQATALHLEEAGVRTPPECVAVHG